MDGFEITKRNKKILEDLIVKYSIKFSVADLLLFSSFQLYNKNGFLRIFSTSGKMEDFKQTHIVRSGIKLLKKYDFDEIYRDFNLFLVAVKQLKTIQQLMFQEDELLELL